MSNKKELEPFKDETGNIIANSISALAEGLTGIATSSKEELILSLSHTFQRMRGGQFLSTFQKEWEEYREKGKVEEDYQYTEQSQVCLQELLEFLDKDSPSEVRFKILKQIFLVAASEELSDRDSCLPQQFMKISRSLSDGEIIVLSTAWEIDHANDGDYEINYGANRWIHEVTESSGLRYTELVETYEQDLMDKKLLTPRVLGDGSGIIINPHFRLSSLGYELCRYIETYEDGE